MIGYVMLHLRRAAGSKALNVHESDPAGPPAEVSVGLRQVSSGLAIVCLPAAIVGATLFYSVPYVYRIDELPLGQLVPWAITFALAGARLVAYPKARAVGYALLATACLM